MLTDESENASTQLNGVGHGAGSSQRDELLRRVDNIADVLRAHRDFANTECQLAPEVVAALDEAELFAMFTPAKYGGLETGVTVATEVVAALAHHCGSAAWVVMIVAGSNLMSSRFSEQAQDEIYGPQPRARLASVLNPTATCEKVDGGYLFTGTWPFSSSILHDHWAVLGGFERTGLVPIDQITVERTWDTVGLRGTGSHTAILDKVFVPDHRTLETFTLMGLQACEDRRLPAGLRVGPVASGATLVASVVLGLGQAAVEYVASNAAKRPVSMTIYLRQADSGAFVANLGESAMKVETARLHVAEAARILDEAAAQAVAPTSQQLRKLRGGLGHAMKSVTGALDDLMGAGGAGSMANAHPLQPIWRDANTGARHGAVAPAVNYELYGGSLIGLDPIAPLL
jgi:alkylation response protein AidB-like acyl-CoA dehydrogenase